MSFVEHHGLWTGEQKRQAKDAAQAIKKNKLELVRFSFADQHGVLRGKTLLAADALAAMESGVTMTTTLLAKDTAHKTAYPVFTPGGGFGMAELSDSAAENSVIALSLRAVVDCARSHRWTPAVLLSRVRAATSSEVSRRASKRSLCRIRGRNVPPTLSALADGPSALSAPQNRSVFAALGLRNLRYGFTAARDTHGFPSCGAINEFTQPCLCVGEIDGFHSI